MAINLINSMMSFSPQDLLRSRGAFAEFLLEQLNSNPGTSSSSSALPSSSPSSLSDSEREGLRLQLEEAMGEKEVARAMKEAKWGLTLLRCSNLAEPLSNAFSPRKKKLRRKKSKRKHQPRVKTTSIGSLSDPDSDRGGRLSDAPESVFSLGASLNVASKAGGSMLQRGESLVEVGLNAPAAITRM